MAIPHVCPCCKGEGKVANGSYVGTTALTKDCPACKGAGIVWGTEIEPTLTTGGASQGGQ